MRSSSPSVRPAQIWDCRWFQPTVPPAFLLHPYLRKVSIQLPVVLVSFQELPLDQALNALLDDCWVGHEAAGELLRDLTVRSPQQQAAQ